MKRFLFAALATTICTASMWAANEDDSRDQLSKESIETVDRFVAILSKIKDKKSADEVRKDFDETAKKMMDLKMRMEKLGEPSAERQAELKKMFGAKFDASIKKLQDEFERIAKNVDGGKEIVQDLSKSLAPLNKKNKKG